MAHAYTPGLRVAQRAVIRRERRLPLRGEVLVSPGDRVRRDQVVARAQLPGEVTLLNLVNRLGIAPEELPRYMLKKEGEGIVEGEPLAETRPLIRWFKTVVKSPVTGIVESISPVTGQVMLRHPPRPVEVLAYVDGTVLEVFPGEGVRLETCGAFVQGIFGVGGEGWGMLRVIADRPDQVLEVGQLGPECAGQIVVGGSLLTYPVIEQARRMKAVGVIGGGIRDQDLRQLLGYDLGVAITGTEEIGLTVIVTEGFGQIAMARKTFEILKSCSGREASICGATQIRAGVIRPEIIVPFPEMTKARVEVAPKVQGLKVGDLLRVIRVPHFGRIGRVSALPAELQQVESGAKVRVLEVEFEDGSRAVVPRANVEIIEE